MAPETLLIYRLCDVPPGLHEDLPEDAGPRACLFWIARKGSQVFKGLVRDRPENDIDCAKQGMAVAFRVMKVAARGRRLADLLRPDEVAGPIRSGTYGFGFYAGAADLAESWIQAHGHTCLPVSEALRQVVALRVKMEDGAPATRVLLRFFDSARPRLEEVDCIEPGLFAIDRDLLFDPPWFLFSDGQGASLSTTGEGFQEVRLVHTPVPDRPPVVRPSREGAHGLTLSRAVEIIHEVFAEPARMTDPHSGESLSVELKILEVNEDGSARARFDVHDRSGLRDQKDQPVVLIPAGSVPDESRYRALFEGVRQAVPSASPYVMPADLVATEYLRCDDLRTAQDFAKAVFDPQVLGRRLARAECVRVLGEDAASLSVELAVDLWRLLPQTVLDRSIDSDPWEVTARLRNAGVDAALLRTIAERWTQRFLEDGGEAERYQHLYSGVMEALGTRALS